MTVSITRIPDQIAANATVTYVPDTSKNTSESGVSGRKLMRPLLRNYLVTISPDYADEMQAIVMAAGTRYPLSMRDPVANSLVEEEALIASDGASAFVGKTWAPSTGNLSVFERVLILDGSVLIKINGVAYSTPAAALEARSAGQQKYLSDLARDADPIQGKARIIIPDADRLRPWVAQTMTRLAKRPVVGEALDFEVQMERLDNRAAAEAIEKSGTFESATIIEQNDVRDPPLGDADYLVWFQGARSIPTIQAPGSAGGRSAATITRRPRAPASTPAWRPARPATPPSPRVCVRRP